jgi:hypothetical protein
MDRAAEKTKQEAGEIMMANEVTIDDGTVSPFIDA